MSTVNTLNPSERLRESDFAEKLKKADCRCTVISGKDVKEIRNDIAHDVSEEIANRLFGDAGDGAEIVVFANARYAETMGNVGSALVYVVGGGEPVLLNSNAAMNNVNEALDRFAASAEFAGEMLVEAIYKSVDARSPELRNGEWGVEKVAELRAKLESVLNAQE